MWGAQGSCQQLGERARALYGVAELLKMVAVGVIFAAWEGSDGKNAAAQAIALLCISGGQFLYLVVYQPFTERGLQVVEAFGALCEAAMFLLALLLALHGGWSRGARDALAYLMLTSAALGLAVQLINHWLALAHQLRALISSPDDDDKESPDEGLSDLSEDEDISRR